MGKILDLENFQFDYFHQHMFCTLQVSNIVPLSVESWHFSLARYLDLRFRAPQLSRRGYGLGEGCVHSINHHHDHYFGMDKMVAVFRLSKIFPRELCIPPPSHIHFKNTATPGLAKEIASTLDTAYKAFFDVLKNYWTIGTSESYLPLVKELIEQFRADRMSFMELKSDIQKELPTRTESKYRILDLLLEIRMLITNITSHWNKNVSSLLILRQNEIDTSKTKKAPPKEIKTDAVIANVGSIPEVKPKTDPPISGDTEEITYVPIPESSPKSVLSSPSIKSDCTATKDLETSCAIEEAEIAEDFEFSIHLSQIDHEGVDIDNVFEVFDDHDSVLKKAMEDGGISLMKKLVHKIAFTRRPMVTDHQVGNSSAFTDFFSLFIIGFSVG